MLDAVIRFSLRSRLLVLVTSLALLAYGGYLATTLPIDVFPDLDRPRVVIITECPGPATEEVETLVTQAIEIALLGAAGVEAVRSQSTAGLTVIYVEFEWEVEVRAARQTVQERLATIAGLLPDGIRPQMTPPASIMGQIVIAGMVRQAGPRGGILAAISGTPLLAEATSAEVAVDAVLVWRVRDRHRPDSWEEVKLEAAAWTAGSGRPDAKGDMPRAARLTIAGHDHAVEFPTPLEQSLALRTTADWVVRRRLLQIPGVAEVFVQGGDRKQYQVLVDPAALVEYGVPMGAVEEALRASNINTSGGFAVTGEQEQPIRVLGRLGPEPARVLRELEQVPLAAFPERTVLLEQVAEVVEGPQFKRGDAAVNGLPGVVFTIAKQPQVDTRALTGRIAAACAEIEAALPADVVINSELFRLENFIDRGIFNVGEALVIGAALVVVVLFLFLLNLRTTFITPTAIPLSLVITTLVFRLAGMLTGSTLSINVMTLGGIAVAMGELVDDAIVDVENIFRRLKENAVRPEPLPALRVVYEASREIRGAIVFGTAVVILVFLPLFALSGIEGRLFAPLGVAYIVSILASLAVSLTVTPVLSSYLLPNSRATHRADDGLLLRALKILAAPLVRLSMAIPGPLLAITWLGVAWAGWELARLGRDFLPPFDEGSVQVNVTLPPGSSLDASNAVAGVIDAKLRQLQATPERPEGEILHFVRRTGRAELDEHAAPVSTSEYILAINPDCGRHRDEIIEQLLDELASEVPGVAIEVEQPLAHLISHMVSGVYAQIAIKVHGDDLDGLVRTAEQIRRAIHAIPGLTPPVVEPVRKTEELQIRLRVAAEVPLPEGFFVEYGGQFESQARATTRIAILAAVSVVGMFVVLLLLYPSVRIVLQLLNALPTAFIGGAAALVLTRQPLTVASLVGFISLGGIAVRNGILLVTHYFHLMREEGETFSQAMILRGSLERLAPVLMTALTAGIGLVPLVLGGQEPGREILYPVATVILGGLVTSTFCEFLIHPGLFWRFSGRDAARLTRADDLETDLATDPSPDPFRGA